MQTKRDKKDVDICDNEQMSVPTTQEDKRQGPEVAWMEVVRK